MIIYCIKRSISFVALYRYRKILPKVHCTLTCYLIYIYMRNVIEDYWDELELATKKGREKN